METSTFRLASGRVVGVTEFGDRSAERVIVFSHAAPGSSLFDPDPSASAGRAVRIIAIDRPGYGGSELVEPITVSRAAEDIAEYAAAEGITSVGAAGWSAGGRVALALAAANPALVDRLALIGTPAPDEEVPWVGDDNRANLASLRDKPPAEATATLSAMFDQAFGQRPTGESQLTQLATPEVDDEVLAGARERLVEMLDRAMAQGNVGTPADIVSYMLMDLGFDIRDVRAKTLLLYGSADSAIPAAHAQWYKKHLADARIEMVPGAGHLLVIPMWDRVLSHLAPGSKL